MRAGVVLLVLALLARPAWAQTRFREESAQWGFDVAESWARGSEQWLDVLHAEVDARMERRNFRYVAAFFPRGAPDSGLPYILVQVTDAPLRGATWSDIEKAMSAEASKLGRNENLKRLVSEVRVGRCVVDRERARYVMTLTQSVPGAGEMKVLMVGFFGRDCMVQLNCYTAPDDDPAAYILEAAETAAFDAGAAFVPATGSAMARGALIGGAIGAASGLAWWLRRRKAA